MWDTFLFALNAILPIVLLMVLGYVLKRIGLLTDEFLTVGNRFVFRVLLSTLLFYNTYNITEFTAADIRFILYAVAVTVAVFFLALLCTLPIREQPTRRSVLVQCAFRSNYAIIGISLATALYGDEGARAAGLLSVVAIPVFNMLAVIALTVMGPESRENGERKRIPFGKVLKGIITNPLIDGVLVGLLAILIRKGLTALGCGFRLTDITFLWQAIKTVAGMASPLALIILGGRFELSAVKRLAKPIAAGVIARTVLVPALALCGAVLLVPGLEGRHFAAYLALFGSPVAVASAVMAKEMGADDELAGQLVVWTTVCSVFTLFVFIVVFREIGLL